MKPTKLGKHDSDGSVHIDLLFQHYQGEVPATSHPSPKLSVQYRRLEACTLFLPAYLERPAEAPAQFNSFLATL
jgi:hypothetical protein